MTDQETKHYTMLSTQKGVRHGEIYPVVFEKGKSYAIDATLAEQFQHLNAVEEADGSDISDAGHDGSAPNHNEESATWGEKPLPTKEPINENVLDEDPAVLRHAEIPVEAVIAQNDAAAANGDMTPEAQVSLGREDIAATGDGHAEDGPPANQKATAKTTRKKSK